MSDDLSVKILELIIKNIGDTARLNHILESIQKNKTIYNSDQKYVESLLPKLSKKNKVNSEDKTNEELSKESMMKEDEKEVSNVQLKRSLDEAIKKIEKLEEKSMIEEKTPSKDLEKSLNIATKKIDSLENKAKDQAYREQFYKSTGTTLVLSLVLGLFGLLGLGHMYIGKESKGWHLLVIGLVLIVVGIFLWSMGGIGIILIIVYYALWVYQFSNSWNLCKQNNEYIKTTGRSLW